MDIKLITVSLMNTS